MDIKVAPSARENVDVYALAKQIITEEFYAEDYRESTSKLITDDVTYEMVKENYLQIMKQMFGE